MTKLLTMEAGNILSYKNIKFDFENRGLVSIQGVNNYSSSEDNNGSGKSSIGEVFSWIVFGKTFKDLSSKDVINNIVNKDGWGRITFTNDNNEVTVERYLKHKEFGSQTKITVDGKPYTGTDEKDTQQQIIKLLGFDMDILKNVFMFDGSSKKHFVELTDKEQKTILENILNISEIAEYLKTTREEKDILSKNINEVFRKINIQESFIKLAANSIDKIEDAERKFKAQKESKERELLDTIKQLKEDSNVELITEKIVGWKKEIEATEKIRDGVKTELDPLPPLLEELKTVRVVQEEKKEKLEVELNKLRKGRIEAQTKLDVANDNLTEFNNNISGRMCPVCKQEISQEHVNNELNSLWSKIAVCKEILEEARKQELSPQEAMDAANETLKQTKSDIGIVEAEIERLLALNIKATKTINSLNSDVSEIQNAIDKVDSQIENLQLQIKMSNDQESNNAELIEDQKLLIAGYKKAIDSLVKEMDANSKNIKDLEFWEKAFGQSGIRSYILDSAVPILDSYADKFSKFLTDGQMKIKFNTQRLLADKKTWKDEFNVKVTNSKGSGVYEGLSGGEKRRVDIIVLLSLHFLAMNRSKNSLNAIFFDEIFERVDGAGKERLMDLLRHLNEETESLFVITHDDRLSNCFDNILTVVKEPDGFSYIQEE